MSREQYYRSVKTTGLLQHHMIRVLRISAQFTVQSDQSMHRMIYLSKTVVPTMNRLFLHIGFLGQLCKHNHVVITTQLGSRRDHFYKKLHCTSLNT